MCGLDLVPVTVDYGRHRRGLTWDGQYLWCVDNASDEVIQFSPDDGTTIRSFRCPASDARGITFDEVVQAVASACLTGAPNLYFEHGFGELEPVSWDRSDYPQTVTANKGVPSPKWRNFVRSYSKMIVEPSKKKIVSKKGAIRSRNALGKRREREMERERIRGILYSGRS